MATMFSILHAAKRFVHDPADTVTYALCRFEILRKTARAFASAATKDVPPVVRSESVFPTLDVTSVLQELDRTALCTELHLSNDLTAEIFEYANTHLCYTNVDEQEFRYLYKDRAKISSEAGKKFIMGNLLNPENECEAIARLEQDPKLLEIARRYLNGNPRRIDSRLWWSFAVDATESERLKANQTVRFHYDLEGFGFLYFSFYITPVNENSGPHVAVLGTHKNKPLRHILSSVNLSDEEVIATYGIDNIRTLTGPAGFGFAEDTFCFHKASPPESEDRLLLQIRMSY